MNRQTARQTNGWNNRQRARNTVDGKTDRECDRQMDGVKRQTARQKDGEMYKKKDRLIGREKERQ